MDMTLKDYMSKSGQGMDEDEVRSLFRQIVIGIEFCHSQGIMHCDLKLDNILVNVD